MFIFQSNKEIQLVSGAGEFRFNPNKILEMLSESKILKTRLSPKYEAEYRDFLANLFKKNDGLMGYLAKAAGGDKEKIAASVDKIVDSALNLISYLPKKISDVGATCLAFAVCVEIVELMGKDPSSLKDAKSIPEFAANLNKMLGDSQAFNKISTSSRNVMEGAFIAYAKYAIKQNPGLQPEMLAFRYYVDQLVSAVQQRETQKVRKEMDELIEKKKDEVFFRGKLA